MDFPRNRFIEIVKKYVHFRRVQEIQETVKRMRMETNINDRVLLGLKEAEERMIKVAQNKDSPCCLYTVSMVASWENIFKYQDSFTLVSNTFQLIFSLK